jgi:hypothetical protein
MAFDHSHAISPTAIPTTTICQKSPAQKSRDSVKEDRLRRAGTDADVVTAQGSL